MNPECAITCEMRTSEDEEEGPTNEERDEK